MTLYERFADLAVWLAMSIAIAIIGMVLAWYFHAAVSALIGS